MTLPAALRQTGAYAGRFVGFSVPGIEITEEPCGPDDVGDVCRPRWVNRQDHGYLTRVNLARAAHENAPYCCPDTGMHCGEPYLRTTAYGVGDTLPDGFRPYSGGSAAQQLPLNERQALVNRIRESAKVRQNVIAGAVAEVRSRRMWGNHTKHNHRTEQDELGPGPVGIRYIPLVGHGPLSEDALIMAPGHSR